MKPLNFVVLVVLVPSTAFAQYDPLVSKGPIISGVTQMDAWVAWETAHHEGTGTECSAEAIFGGPNTNTPTLTLTPAGMDGDTFTDSACAEDHLVHVTGLSPATMYTFTLDQPWDTNAAPTGPVTGTFLTATPTTDGTFSFVIYGDTRDNPDTESSIEADHQAVVNAIIANEMSSQFLVNTGDMALNYPAISGDDDGYTEYFDVERALLSSRGVFTAIGNHETIDTDYYDALVNANGFPGTSSHPYYWSMDWGQVHITFMDAFEGPADITLLGAHDPEITDAQATWVAQDLAAAQAAGQMLFIVSHQGPYSFSNDSSAHGGSPDFLAKIVPLMLQYGVQAVFAGHDHYYQRGHDGCIDYFVIGGGGADQYMPDATGMGVEFTQEVLSYVVVNINGMTANGQAKDTNGNVLDNFAFAIPDGTACGVAPLDGGTEDGGTIVLLDGGSGFDAGSEDDAGLSVVDSGQPVVDAGEPIADAGSPPDAGKDSHLDAGATARPDAGLQIIEPDAGNSSDVNPGGCHCGAADPASALFMFGLLAAVTRRRSRR